YGISRAAQDAFALQSHQRTAGAQAAGRFDAEIAPLDVRRALFDEEGNPAGHEAVRAARDEGVRADTTAERLAGLKPSWSGGKLVAQGEFVTAGNASQLSD
ncbi:acetyl-CoA C-acyltransferase, partial [Burkholderia cepacia]